MTSRSQSSMAPDAGQSMQELRDHWVLQIGALITIVAGISWMTDGAVGQLHSNRLQVSLAAFGVGVLILLAHRRRAWLGRVALLVGSTACIALAWSLFRHPLVPMFGVVAIVMNFMAGTSLGFSALILNGSVLYSTGLGSDYLIVYGLCFASAGILCCILLGGLRTALDWAWQSQQRANALLAETRDRRGELRRTVDSLTEATRRLEHTRYELALARQQSDEARQIKAAFVANISHELRTPLNVIMGFTEVMCRTPEVYGEVRWTPALRADVRAVYQSGRQLMGMVDDILDLARIEAHRLSLHLEPTALNALAMEAAETVKGLLRGRNVVLETELAEGLPDVLVDRTRIRQAIINLVTNAIRFTEEGTITVAVDQRGDDAIVSVSDTGSGIPPEHLASIFDAFGQTSARWTESRGGIGLGLAICDQFMRLHGGHTEVESRLGVGSTFRLSLPLPTSNQTLSQLSYYAPKDWSPVVPENPWAKTAIVMTQDATAHTNIMRSIRGYRTLLVKSVDDLVQAVSAEHPAGVVLIEDPYMRPAVELEEIWRAVGRQDVVIVRCEVPTHAPAAYDAAIAAHLVKPIRFDDLAATARRLCPAAQRFLIVDGDEGSISLLARGLKAACGDVSIHRAYTGADALAILLVEPIDLVLMNLALPDTSGLDLIRKMRGLLAEIPVLVALTEADYADAAARSRPARIEILRQDGHKRIGQYVGAILDAAPPDYTLPTLSSQP